jgi:hypothetical protein
MNSIWNSVMWSVQGSVRDSVWIPVIRSIRISIKKLLI